MRAPLTVVLSLLVVVFHAHLARSQTTPVSQFSFPKFIAQDELQFYLITNPTFGPEALELSYYAPFGGDDRVEVGAVYYRQRVKLDTFNVTFTVRMSNQSQSQLGTPDGFAFVVQNERGSAFGVGLGYGATPDYEDLGVRRSVAVEFDTFMLANQNEELGDPNDNHISVHHTTNQLDRNSASEDNALSPPGAVTKVPRIAGYTHKYNILYRANVLSVYIDDAAMPTYQAAIDIASIISLNSSAGAFIGLTTSCRAQCVDIDVLNWYYDSSSSPNSSPSPSPSPSPSHVDPSNTYVVYANSSAMAGRSSSIMVQTVGYDGSLITRGGDEREFSVSIEPGTVPLPAVIIGDSHNGSYLIQLGWVASGSYDVTVKYNASSIFNMPLRIVVRAGAASVARSEVLGATVSGVAGELLNIIILAKDSYGNVVQSNEPPITFIAVVESTSNEYRATFVGNGAYLIQFSLSEAGTHYVSVYLSYDRFGNDIDANRTSNLGLIGFWDQAAYAAGAVNLTFTPQADGTLAASYVIDIGGLYRLTVALETSGEGIADGPYVVSIASPCVVPEARPIMPSSLRAWASHAGTGVAPLLSGGAWNSQSYASEHNPVWFEIDLGQNVHLAELRLKVDQKPAEAFTVHHVTGGTMANSIGEVLARLAGVTHHNETLVMPINRVVRFFRVTTTTTPSWVAWGSVLAAFTPVL